MKYLITSLCFAIVSSIGFANDPVSAKSRRIILTDMGNEPDEDQQKMLLNSNKFGFEGFESYTNGRCLNCRLRTFSLSHSIHLSRTVE